MGMTVLGQLLPVGSVIHSMLTEGQFQAQMGSGWVLSDGRSVAGSGYATITGASTIPDARDVFLRGKGNGRGLNPDGDLALGAYAADRYLSHTHRQQSNTGSSLDASTYPILSGAQTQATSQSIITTTEDATPYNSKVNPLLTQASGGSETAPKSVVLNIFIRIN